MATETDTIESLLAEGRAFPPSDAFRSGARVTDDSLWKEAEEDREAFWARQAEQYLSWFKRWDSVLAWEPPYARWFDGGELNASYNALDRHVEAGRSSAL